MRKYGQIIAMIAVHFKDASNKNLTSYVGLAHVGDWNSASLDEEIRRARRFLNFRLADKDITQNEYESITNVEIVENKRIIERHSFSDFLKKTLPA